MERKLSEVIEGSEVIIKRLENEPIIKRRLIDMGIVPGKKVKVLSVAPLGDPIKVDVEGFEVSLRKTEAEIVVIEEVVN